MDDGLGKIKVFPDHFGAATPAPTENCNNFGAATSTPTENCIQKNLPISHPRTDHSLRSRGRSRTQRKIVRAASMLKLFSLRRLQWGSSTDDKIELSAAEVESLRSEIADLEDKEAHLKAQLEHLDEILRSARLAGYLDIRTRWTELPGEPPIDDTDVDDWLPRFVVLHGSCIFFYLISTDLSPQDSTLLSDVVEVGQLPSFRREEEQTLYAFYILTCHGLRFECSSPSEVQVDSWLTALQIDCKLGIDKKEAKGLSNS